jgi:hypothetical protein
VTALLCFSLIVINFGVAYGWWGWGAAPSDMNAWIIVNIYTAAGLAVNAITTKK